MKKQLSKTWFKIEEIPKCNFGMLIPIFEEYGRIIEKMGGSSYFYDVLWIYENGVAKLHYYRGDFEKGINFLTNKAVNKPEWAEECNNKIIQSNQDYFKFAKQIANLDLGDLTDQELVSIFNQLIKLQRLAHNYGQVTTWLIDADKQLFSNYLVELIKSKVNRQSQVAKIFSLLTSPEKPSFTQLEYQESLKIALDIAYKTKLVKSDLSRNKKIINHWKKYLWIYYNYEGPALEPDYFVEVIKVLTKENSYAKIKKMLLDSKNKFIEIKKQRKQIFVKLGLNAKEKQLFDIARDIVWLKAYRKDCMYYGCYVLDRINQEIARRLNITLKQTRFLSYHEMEETLINKQTDQSKLDERYVYSVIYTNSKEFRIHSGKNAQVFLQTHKFEAIDNTELAEIKGMCACPGKACGVVKIIETSEDMIKMNQGDILLSETTYPALVPAMKKAAAIVTNVGGLTCHAAIVSRELKIPCIVGTKVATKVFHDGDFVEVDANKGIIRRIK